MNKLEWLKKEANQRVGYLRRGVAGLLSGALLLGMVAPGAFARDITSDVHVPTEGEKPQITIESNGVIDDFGNLTGYLEVALRVKIPEDQTFTYLGVSLEYNSDILTPVNWVDSEGETTLVDMTGTTPDSYKTQALFRTLKDKQITTAISHVSGPYTATETPGGGDGGDTPAARAGDTPNGLFYIEAETTKPVTLTEDTMLAAVRFQYDLNKLDQTQNPWLNLPEGVKLPADVDPDSYDSTKWLPGGTNWLVRFASDAVANANPGGSYVGQQLLYKSGKGKTNDKNQFYYSSEGENSAGYVVAVEDGSGTLNRTSNLLTYDGTADANIRFTLQNRPTYDAEVRSNFATIVYFDYTDKMIGVQTVLPGDARVAVNTYVERNFIYPDLRYSEHMNDADSDDYMDSLDRKYNYRGKYPYDKPRPMDDPGGKEFIRTNGNNFPLTSHLDYSFYKYYTESTVVADPDNSYLAPKAGEEPVLNGDETIEWTTKDMSTVTDPAVADLPYINGWAVIDDLDNIENVWTTFGVGELANCDPTADTYTTKDESAYFQLADFSDLENGQVIYVKACYTPGTDLKPNFPYAMIGEPTLRRYTYTASTSTGGATYVVKYQYERSTVFEGLVYGPSRARDPVVQVRFEPDVAGYGIRKGELDPFYMEQRIDNAEIIDVALTPAAAIVSMDYVMIDRYSSNFMTGSERSKGGDDREIIAPDNFDYAHFNFGVRLGSQGLVYTATALTVLEEGLKKDKGEENLLANHWILETIKDLNLRSNSAGKEFVGREVAAAQQTFENMIKTARNTNHYTDDQVMGITWHQMQYYFLHNVLLSDADAKAAETYAWCRMDDGCVDAAITIVSDFETLMKAAGEAALSNDYNSLNTLLDLNLVTGTIYLRADGEGNPFADLDSFKAAIVDVVRNAGTFNLTWGEVQYALLHGNVPGTPADAETAFNEEYWWYNGGQKVTDWDSFLAAVADAATSGRNAIVNTAKGDDLLKITHNLAQSAVLASDGSGNYVNAVPYEEADFTQLISHLAQAQSAAAVKFIQNPSWDQVQYYLLEGEFNTDIDMDEYGRNHYWWYDGGTLIVDAESLIKAMTDSSRPAALKQLTIDQINNDPLNLRKDFAGSPFADMAEFQATLGSGIPYDVIDWDRLQYYLIHGNYVSNSEAASYYWWKPGTRLTAPVISNNNINTFVNAAFYAACNGRTDAWDNLTLDYINKANFRNPTTAELTTLEMFDDLPLYTDMDTFKGRMEALVTKALAGNSHPHTPPTLTWYQIQKYLVTEEYDDTSTEADLAKVFWWRTGGNSPNVKTNFTKLLEYMAAYKADGNATTFNSAISLSFLTASDMAFRGANGGTITSRNISTARTSLRTLVNAIDADDIPNLTWSNVQYALYTKGGVGTDTYAWEPSGWRQPTAGGTMALASYDAEFAAFQTFLANNAQQTAPEEPTPVYSASEDGKTTTESTRKQSYDPETQKLTLLLTDKTTTTETWETETAYVTKTILTTVVREIVMDIATGETSEKIETLPAEITVTEEEKLPVEELDPGLQPEDPEGTEGEGQEPAEGDPAEEEKPLETEEPGTGETQEPEEPTPVIPEEGGEPDTPVDEDQEGERQPEEGETPPDTDLKDEEPPLSELPEEPELPSDKEEEALPEKVAEGEQESTSAEDPDPAEPAEAVTTNIDIIRQMISMRPRGKTGGYGYAGVSRLWQSRTGLLLSGGPPLRSIRQLVLTDRTPVNTLIIGRISA